MDAQQLQEQGKQQVNGHLRADRPAYVIEAAPVAKPVRLQEHDMGPRAIGSVFDHLKAIITGLQCQESRQQTEKKCRIMQRCQAGEPPLKERAIIQPPIINEREYKTGQRSEKRTAGKDGVSKLRD